MSASVVEVGRDRVAYAIGGGTEPVATVAAGARLRIATELNIGDHLRKTSDTFDASMVKLPYINPATGPIIVDGATPAHALVCDLESIELEPPGFTALVPGFGPFVDWVRGREFGTHARVVDIVEDEIVWDDHRRIPIAPMVGLLGTAPLVGAVSTIDNGPHGGNLDVQEMGPGCRVTLPIQIDGAHFFLGDCHAIQGDGELCGLGAIEIRTHTTVRLDLIARPATLRWPRIETREHIGVVACARPLEDAFRLAVEDLVAWMTADFAFAEHEGILLLGQVAEARCTQLVNPKYTYLVKIAKRWLC